MSETKKWVMIIDDASASRKITANYLHKNGFQVILAEDGEQASNILKYCTPDCILLDIVMPKMHGHAFLSQLRENNKELPVIVISAVKDQPALVATMEKLGITGWFQKPNNSEEVTKRIREVVGLNPETEDASSGEFEHTEKRPKQEEISKE